MVRQVIMMIHFVEISCWTHITVKIISLWQDKPCTHVQ